jgi:hypothetical protein
MSVAKSNAEMFANQIGVEPSMTEQEMIEYMYQVTKEIKKK